MPAGSVADMYDRRIVAMLSLSISLVGATALTLLTWFGTSTRKIPAGALFVVGCGMALFGARPGNPRSASRLPAETLPSAVA